MEENNFRALLPIGVFLVLYLGLGLLFEYGLDIYMGFYNIPIVVIFMIALVVACVQNPALKFDDKLSVMARGLGDKNIVAMILIFLLAGAFVGVVGRSGAEGVAYFVLSLIPPKLIVLVLFVVSAFVSLAMGTSVGTITLLTPIAITVAQGSGFGVPLCVGVTVGGAMFGDNLSVISDTTIAVCNGQDCDMRDKFRANFKIAIIAFILTLIVLAVVSFGLDVSAPEIGDYRLIHILPYILVLAGSIVGINVFVVLIIGIVSGAVIMLLSGVLKPTELLSSMGTGVSGMLETVMVAVLVAIICALITEYGGFTALLSLIKRTFKQKRGGQLGIGLLVGLMVIATANNTVAIVISNPIARDMSQTYGISKQRTASLLDIFSCVFQSLIPYGAQMLIAVSTADTLGYNLTAFEVIPFLVYPFALLIVSLGAIALDKDA